MAGRGDRRATPRLVSGATVRMGFRGPKRAKTCANRKDDQLGILSRCARDDVWLKTFTTSNHRNSASRMRGLSLCFCRRIRPLAMPKPARAQKAGTVHALLSASLDCPDQSYAVNLGLCARSEILRGTPRPMFGVLGVRLGSERLRVFAWRLNFRRVNNWDRSFNLGG